MKKNSVTIIACLICLTLAPFITKAQQAKVTVTIDELTALSTDACNGKMDFYAKIHIGGKIKTIPVREGNVLRDLNWQFSSITDLELIPTMIEIWDEDDAICGGGDDEVCVAGNLNKIRESYSTREFMNKSYRSVGTVKSGAERAGITYTITVEPTKTGLLTQGNWKELRQEFKTGSGPWEELLASPPPAACKTDNYFVFHRDGRYERNEGATKCSPDDPQSKIFGTWNFLIRETRIQIKFTEYRTTLILFSIEKLDENTMMLTRSEGAGEGATYTRTTYIH